MQNLNQLELNNIMTYDDNKLKTYLNLNHSSILSSLFTADPSFTYHFLIRPFIGALIFWVRSFGSVAIICPKPFEVCCHGMKQKIIIVAAKKPETIFGKIFNGRGSFIFCKFTNEPKSFFSGQES